MISERTFVERKAHIVSSWANKMKEDIVKLIEIEIKSIMEQAKEDYNIGVIDGLIKAIKLIEG